MHKKKAILVVSFGTSYNDSREKTIDAIADTIAYAFPQYTVHQAFTSKVIINTLKIRDHIHIDTVTQALQRLVKEGYQELVIQPTHLVNGIEYDKMVADAIAFKGQFDKIQMGKPLLTTISDYDQFIQAVLDEIPEKNESHTAVIFMGHGTTHFANAAYAALDYHIKHKGYRNVFVGTVESYPDVQTVREDVLAFGAKKAVLYPIMIVAGDHAHNDMAGNDEDSWTSILQNDVEVTSVLKGLGEYKGIRNMFVNHVADALEIANKFAFDTEIYDLCELSCFDTMSEKYPD